MDSFETGTFAESAMQTFTDRYSHWLRSSNRATTVTTAWLAIGQVDGLNERSVTITAAYSHCIAVYTEPVY